MAIAPTGVAGMCWYHGELELAKAAAAAKIPFTLATGAMTPMEEIAEKAAGRLWMQLYVWEKRELSYELINRAKNCGFEALIVTVDTAVSPNREYNAKNGFHQPFRMTTKATFDMLSRPRWMATVLARYAMQGGLPKYENYPKHLQHSIRTDPNVEKVMRRDSLSWEDIKIFRKMWPGILMVKGINRPDDAVKAAEYGCDGIIVSNHGGRNMDSAVCLHRRAAGYRRGGRREGDGAARQRRAARLRHRQGAGVRREGRADRTCDALRHVCRRTSRRRQGDQCDQERARQHHGLCRRQGRRGAHAGYSVRAAREFRVGICGLRRRVKRGA